MTVGNKYKCESIKRITFLCRTASVCVKRVLTHSSALVLLMAIRRRTKRIKSMRKGLQHHDSRSLSLSHYRSQFSTPIRRNTFRKRARSRARGLYKIPVLDFELRAPIGRRRRRRAIVIAPWLRARTSLTSCVLMLPLHPTAHAPIPPPGKKVVRVCFRLRTRTACATLLLAHCMRFIACALTARVRACQRTAARLCN